MGYITVEVISENLRSKNIDLLSTHTKLSIPIINRLYKKMVNGIKFDDIKVCENLIIDGHH
jgi:transcription antitermination factor NusA-like protein